jgi:DNA-binding transcriptional ArsR family regulator
MSQMPRFAAEDGGDEVWVESTPHTSNAVRRSARDVDPKRVEAGRKLALLRLMNEGDYTKAELAKIFGMSPATLYRHIEQLRAMQELAAKTKELRRAGLVEDFDEDFDEGYDEDYDEDYDGE